MNLEIEKHLEDDLVIILFKFRLNLEGNIDIVHLSEFNYKWIKVLTYKNFLLTLSTKCKILYIKTLSKEFYA